VLSTVIPLGVSTVGFSRLMLVGVPTSYLVTLGFCGSIILTLVPEASTCLISVHEVKSTLPVRLVQF
jgi:hypothetical protein